MMTKWTFLLISLWGVLLSTACYPAPAPVQAYPPTPAENQPLPTPIPSGQEIVYADFRVTMSQAEIMTSYITEYGSRRDASPGTMFLWIHILLKNIGQIERPLPIIEHFSVLYGASEFKPSYGHRQGYADYTSLKPVIYQGQQADAWLRFDIPATAELKDLQFAFLPESLQMSISFAPTDYPWADHPIYLWSCAP
jgi:hypothetical protein